jgi:hypothetical protein
MVGHWAVLKESLKDSWQAAMMADLMVERSALLSVLKKVA